MGVAIDYDKPYVDIPCEPLKLIDLPIGMMEYPIQSVRVANLGVKDVLYEICDDEIANLCRANMDYNVVTLLSDKVGTLKANEFLTLNLTVRPISVGHYTLSLPIILKCDLATETKSKVLVWNGIAHPDMTGIHASLPKIREFPRISHDGLSLSQDVVDCGVFPTQCWSQSQIFTVTSSLHSAIIWHYNEDVTIVSPTNINFKDQTTMKFEVKLRSQVEPRVFCEEITLHDAVSGYQLAQVNVRGMSLIEIDLRLFGVMGTEQFDQIE